MPSPIALKAFRRSTSEFHSEISVDGAVLHKDRLTAK